VDRVTLEEAYPRIAFRRRTHNWWARLVGQPAECVHLETQHSWMATLAPDMLYLRGKGVAQREPLRPEVSLCLDCLIGVLESELAAYRGRVVAFEPHEETFSQYFFLAAPDFEAAGLMPEVAAAIEKRLAEPIGSCAECSAPAEGDARVSLLERDAVHDSFSDRLRAPCERRQRCRNPSRYRPASRRDSP